MNIGRTPYKVIAILLLAGLLAGGCQTVPTQPAHSAATTNEPIVDPCAMRLHDIGGAILLYYALNRQLPVQLSEAAILSQTGDTLQLACPVSGKAYVYDPNGLQIPGTNKRVIVYDATPAHDGKRNCLIMPVLRGGQAMSTDVRQIPEATFATFRPAGHRP